MTVRTRRLKAGVFGYAAGDRCAAACSGGLLQPPACEPYQPPAPNGEPCLRTALREVTRVRVRAGVAPGRYRFTCLAR